MLHTFLAPKVAAWFAQSDCPVTELITHIEAQGHLRTAQIEAIKTYLYLKIEGENRPLYQLFSEGFFTAREDLSRLALSVETREFLQNEPPARALHEFARIKLDAKPISTNLEKILSDQPKEIDSAHAIKQIFYGVDYSDYLFSLPMGAGKTFLMAAFIYLDLYFALNDPDNKAFAHNFIVLAPSGLKSSIVPSLKTIENFNAGWVLPEPAASQVKKLIHFELLDQPKSGSKSNKAQNPNAQKVASHQPFDSLMGLVLVTNAEKVILDKLKDNGQAQLIEDNADEKERAANELRAIIGKLPNLQILIDEVHHAATDDIKLRRVVNNWNAGGNINSVLGFTGTPYLSGKEKIEVGSQLTLQFSQITNTVFYYPLKLAIQNFLKKPQVHAITRLDSLQIVKRGVQEFLEKYKALKYADGTVAKLAIYCGSIERLETEIYPLLTGEMSISPELILKYHRGNKAYPAPESSEAAFLTLDSPTSKIRIVLLVQIGKEGWNCRSLTGVILSQKGDCPTNMVLQTSCRCLREVVPGQYETAGIWLNEDNAKILDKKLKEEQHTSIAELNNLSTTAETPMRERFARADYLKLPPLDFYQLRIDYSSQYCEDPEIPRQVLATTKLNSLDVAQHNIQAEDIERDLTPDSTHSKTFINELGGQRAHFSHWIHSIARESFGAVSRRELEEQQAQLEPIFKKITLVDQHGVRRFNDVFDHAALHTRIRLAFHRARELQTTSEIVPRNARLLIVENLKTIAADRKLFPTEQDCTQILEMDAAGQTASDYIASQNAQHEEARKLLESSGFNVGLLAAAPTTATPAVANKERSFQHLPYDFTASDFEQKFLTEALTRKELAHLELYYNGERSLTEFKIECAARENKQWKRVGEYTPDFLLIERKQGKIYRALIIETKGSGFAEQKEFKARRTFVEEEFLRLNEEKFGYRRFEYLYLADSEELTVNLRKLCDKASEFFAA